MKFLRVAVVGALMLLLPSISALAQDMPPPFGGPDDLSFASRLWTVLEGDRLVGTNAIQSTTYQGGTPPHTETLVTLQGIVTVGGEQGIVIVKNNYAPGTEQAAVFADPTAGLMMITVMFQRAAGYDPDNQDWFWAGYMPNGALMQNNGMGMAGRVAKGMETGCIFCHSNAPGGDYVFLHDAVAAR